MKFHAEKLKLILLHPFGTAHARVSSATSVVLKVEDEGLFGLGEAPTSGYLGQNAMNDCADALAR